MITRGPLCSVRRSTVLLALATWSCVDGLPTEAVPGALPIPVQFAIEPASGISADEESAIDKAFDQLTQLRIRITRPGESEPFIDTLVAVQPGQDSYAIELSVPAEDAAVHMRVVLTGLAGSVELFTAEVQVTVRLSGADAAGNGSAVGSVISLPIRYTGPGLGGLVLDPDGIPVQGIVVDLFRGGVLVQTATTGANGEYLFTDLQPLAYVVRVRTDGAIESCPAQRDIEPLSVTSRLVGGFKLSRTNCQLKVLVLTGGDVNDNGGVIGGLSSSIPEGTFSSAFVVVNPPSLSSLLEYDAIVLYENGTYEHAVEVGDRVAEYIDAGGNLVIGSFYWQNRSDGGFGNGGWGALEGVDPFSSAGGAVYGPGSLGTVTPHPITAGVSSLTASRWWGGVSAKGGTSVVASWADGTPLAGYVTAPGGQRIVAISAFPGLMSDCCTTGDFTALWANAVQWAARAGGPTRVASSGGG